MFDAVERERGPGSFERLTPKLPARLHGVLAPERLRSAGPLETILLDEAEEALLALDTALGDGSGRVLEAAAVDLFSRALSQPGSIVRGADAMSTLARLRAAFERPFLEEALLYEVASVDNGLSLSIGVSGRPRTARLLRPLAVGAVRVVHRFAYKSADEFKVFSEVVGDRARISVLYTRSSQSEPALAEEQIMRSRRPPRTSKSVQHLSLSAEVERILVKTRAPGEESEES